ncbi:MAG: carbon monoxide dehydrogenase subunit G [Hyphomicrobiales bacterium]|nr:carbon monoxide dehydrogenase subunit G [Hyphomicrobiales bacterium]
MDISGEYIVPASRELVWELLNDPEVLRQCIPGCEEILQTAEDEFSAKVVLKMGPVKAKFDGSVRLSDKNYPHSYRISGEGKGGIAGFAKGGADILLTEVEDGTRLNYQVDAQIGGKIAQLGSRLVTSTSKKLAGKFFETFCEIAAQRI